jgi:hypothetical protein
MKKEVSIVLSRAVRNYRRLAQEWFGLTDEQMVDMDVHHNPAQCEGGRNIPEHLFVYHFTLHAAVHEAAFILWRKEANRKGGTASMKKGVGIFNLTPEQYRDKSLKAAQTSLEKGVGCVSASPEQKAEWTKLQSREAKVAGGKSTFEAKKGAFAISPEERKEIVRRVHAQRWRCLETGHISSPTGLSSWQRARGIDTSLREKLE